MTAEELESIGQEVYGRYGWQTAMARDLRIDASTIRRYKMAGAKSAMPIPPERAEEIRALRDRHRATMVRALGVGAEAAVAAPPAPAMTTPGPDAVVWHRRVLLLLAAARTMDELMRRDGRGQIASEVLDVLGRIVVRLVLRLEGCPLEVLSLGEGDGLEAVARAEARLRELTV